MEEALSWASRCPAGEKDIIEVRPIFGMEEFPAETRKAARSDIVDAALENSL